MFGYTTEKIPPDFGVLLTPHNIESHLAKILDDHGKKTLPIPLRLRSG